MSIFFDANGEDINFGSATDIDNAALTEFTMMIWAYLTSTTGTQVLYGKNTASFTDGWHMTINQSGGAGNLQSQRKYTGGDQRYRTSTGFWTANQWSYIACAVEAIGTSPAMRIYHGDISTPATEETTYAINENGGGTVQDSDAANLLIGNTEANQNLEIAGYIGFACLADRALTEEEIIAVQFAPRNFSGVLLMCWPGMNGASTVTDYSGNDRTGTIDGATQGDIDLPLVSRFGYDLPAMHDAAVAPAGRIMSSMAGAGGLVGQGGLAGSGGGLAG